MNNIHNSNLSDTTQKWVDLLVPFSNNYSALFSATDISKMTGIPQQTASRELNKLAKNNMIDHKIIGRNKMFYFNLEKQSSKNMMNIIEYQKSLRFLVENKKISTIINEIILRCKSVILFGSYAKGIQDRKSDIDIAIFGMKKDISEIKKKYTIKINEHNVTYSEFGKHLKNENPLSIEIAHNHIMFGNISDLVDILWNWNYAYRQR
ncbi:MAG: hypothetical protein GQ477_05150 [Nanohaloarchaea archaeon]|nr:hypothetical protein [Candidatus Nanohaloarchaea archaeon]